MVLDIDMFSSRMEDRVVGQGYGSLVIAFQWDDNWCTTFRLALSSHARSLDPCGSLERLCSARRF